MPYPFGKHFFGDNTDAPSTDDEGTTARSAPSLLKGIKNYLKALAATISGGKIGVSGAVTVAIGGIASGAIASGAVASGAIASGAMAAGSQADGHSATLGLSTAAPADVVEDTTARTGISLWKGIKNYLKTLAGAVSGTKMLVTADPVTGTVTANQGTAGATPWPTTDNGPAWTSVWGVSNAPVTSADMSGAAVAVIDAPTAGLKFVITDIVVTAAAAMLFTFTEETSGLVLAYASVAANGTAQVTPRSKRKTAVAVKRVMCQSSAAGNVSVLVGGYTEA